MRKIKEKGGQNEKRRKAKEETKRGMLKDRKTFLAPEQEPKQNTNCHFSLVCLLPESRGQRSPEEFCVCLLGSLWYLNINKSMDT